MADIVPWSAKFGKASHTLWLAPSGSTNSRKGESVGEAFFIGNSMAGEWIKVRTNLWTDPRVSQLCDLTDERKATMIGALYWLWSSADEHTLNGHMPGLSVKGIDRDTGIPGMGAALVVIGWVEDTVGGITLVRFDEHNGTSAKTRAQTAKRVANFKSNADSVTQALPERYQSVSGALPREEKRREENIKSVKSKADASASRLPADWTPTEADETFCKTERSDLNVKTVVSRFRDYWIAQPGVKGKKADWSATWRNWVRNEKTIAQARASPYQTPNEKAKEWADRLTGANRHEQRPDIIDITPSNIVD